jgi:hypothetical protein
MTIRRQKQMMTKWRRQNKGGQDEDRRWWIKDEDKSRGGQNEENKSRWGQNEGKKWGQEEDRIGRGVGRGRRGSRGWRGDRL